MLHNKTLKSWLKKLNLIVHDFCKMTNDSVDQKVLCFLQDIIANSTTAIKSHLSASSCEEIKKIGEMFPSNAQPNNTEEGN